MTSTPTAPPAFWQVEVTLPRSALPPLEAALEPLSVAISWIEVDEGQDLWTLQALCVDRPDDAVVLPALALAAAAAGVPEPEPVVIRIEGRDWLAQSAIAFPPLRAGRVYIHGSHHTEPPPVGSWPLRLDAATAFGSGDHESTRGCLLAFDALARQGRARNVLDVGCGSGILGLAAARAWACPVLGLDIDPESVRVARFNVHRNGLGAFVRVVPGVGVSGRLAQERAPYDLIFANILARPLCALAHPLSKCLAPGGRVILAGLLTRQAAQVLSAYRRQGLVLERRLVLGAWTTLVLRHPPRRGTCR
ncbi:50S ribosomal protein L11 methyltransferase [Pararhodospirillum oryzae]|uniref:Ribosomal protein L11 methyltransferase n=1 Tax=Pararhodospirillum oryzae TaxID=478448 RepID=A0A512H4Y5_9PROT|nr:50S ribosomal protein L11 methyltransferase [Pararhodospirillum oryzae]GEO80450.1 ribosomal protein L11 methyltransferase [Pararhodospirillum oryzae]